VKLDREGIFKARPVSFGVKPSAQSQSLAVVMEFVILAQLDGTEWVDWSEYEEHRITGYFYVIKADGTVNVSTVDQLGAAIAWNGDLDYDPSAYVVQITVKNEEYNGRSSLKVGWINPGDFTPSASVAPPEEVTSLKARFGSLLRAAASTAPKPVKQEKLPF